MGTKHRDTFKSILKDYLMIILPASLVISLLRYLLFGTDATVPSKFRFDYLIEDIDFILTLAGVFSIILLIIEIASGYGHFYNRK